MTFPLPHSPKLHIDTDQLSSDLINDADVATWNGFSTVDADGTAGLPKLRTDEAYRYVRFGTVDATTTKGNYLDFGTQTWNRAAGFTAVGIVRFYATKFWQRWFDFGNGPGTGVLWGKNATTAADIRFEVYQNGGAALGSTRVNVLGAQPNDVWLITVARMTAGAVGQAWVDPAKSLAGATSVAGTMADASVTMTNNWLGRSNWAADSLACMDVRESAFYDRALSDAELGDVVAYMRIKYAGERLALAGNISLADVAGFVTPTSAPPHSLTNMRRSYISSPTGVSPNVGGGGVRLGGFRDAGWGRAPTDIGVGAYAWYTADSWSDQSQVWNDVSGNARHATTVRGTINRGVSTDPYGVAIDCLSGGTDAGIRFPVGVLPATHTLFHLSRYTGGARGRIFDGVGTLANNSTLVNWLSGFWSGKSGVAHNQKWNTQNTASVHGDTWFVSCDQNSLYRSDMIQRNTGTSTNDSPQISINYGNYTMHPSSPEPSDWAVAEVIVFDRKLSVLECLQVEQYLTEKLGAARPKREYPPSAPTFVQAAETYAGDGGVTYAYYDGAVAGQAHGNGTYRVWASSIFSYGTASQWLPAYAFNKTASNAGWASSSGTAVVTNTADAAPPPTLYVQLPSSIRPISYSMQARTSGAAAQLPLKWRFEASQDAVNWTALDARDNEPAWLSGEQREYQLSLPHDPAPRAYSAFRVVVLRTVGSNAENGGGVTSINELRIYGGGA